MEDGDMASTNELVGARIRVLRKESGFTQADLAEKAELTPNFVALLESGNKSFSLKTIDKIARSLKVPIKELFNFPEKKSASQLFAEDLMKILHRRSADDVALIKDIATRIFQKR
jgi:transcriptional regulator with XRE-family HTH domain